MILGRSVTSLRSAVRKDTTNRHRGLIDSMDDRLAAKTAKYEALLAEDYARAELLPADGTPLRELATAHMEMAGAYLSDGRHFEEEGDMVNALAAYSYGHGWLDAAIRGGLVSGQAREPASVDRETC